MSTRTLPMPTTEKRIVSARANALAERLEEGARALYAFAKTLTDEEWRTPVSATDRRTVGLVVNHVALMYPLEIEFMQIIADGKPLPGVTMNDIHAINAQQATEYAGVTKVEALERLQVNSMKAAAAIRNLTSDQLDRATPAPLYYGAPITCQFMIEDHAMRHSYHSLGKIRAAVGR